MADHQANDKKSGAFGGIGRALSSRNFVYYCTGLGFSLTGTFVFFVALGWVTWELTNSVAWVGTIVLAETLPNAIVGPFAGVIIDRTSARRALFWAQLLGAITMASLAVVTLNNWITIEILMGFAVLLGSLNGIAFPAHFAIMPKLVPRENLTAAIAFQSSVSQAARFLGPAVAGILIVWGGGGMAFALNSLTYIPFLVALSIIKIDESRGGRPASLGVVRDMVAGLQYAWSSISIRVLLILAVALGIFLRPIVELMPAYVGSVLKSDAVTLAWLLAAAGAGAMFASLWLAWKGITQGLTKIMLLNFAATVVILVAFLIPNGLAIGVALMFVYGFCSTAVMISNQT
ncbi:MAG: MFS transporter, partial [Rhodospirillales bacterium]|nr:MFS transporter [Rhodospirillales bacterium]